MVLNGDLGVLNKKIEKALNEVIDINSRTLELVTDFLNAADSEKNNQSKSRPIDAIGVIKDIIREISVLAKQKSVGVFLKIEPASLKTAVIKADNFSEVIKNLLSNSIKYNKPNGRADVILKKVNQKILITIKDTGIGIPKKDQKKMFGRFFRAGNAIKKATEGSGLGLYIVKSYVKKWGGKIDFKSIEGRGTTFNIEIPIK